MIKLFLTVVPLGFSLSAAQNDVFPTDYVSNKLGDIVTTLYYTDSSADAYYRNGTKIMNESLSTSLEALRIGYTTNIYGFTTALTAVGFYAKNTFDGATLETLYPKNTSGYGDFRLGITTWLLNDRERMQYFAITPMISIPIGTYDSSRSINIGENCYKATLSAGYVNRFLHGDAGELFIELCPEIAFFGDNNNARGDKLEQKTSYALTGYVRYRPIPIVGIFAGYQMNHGGETILNSVVQNNAPETTKMMIGGAVFVYGTQVIVRHAEDIHVENAFKINRQTTLRAQWNF